LTRPVKKRSARRRRPFALRGIKSFWIKNAECIVENDKITMYRVNGKISFLVEERQEQHGARRVA